MKLNKQGELVFKRKYATHPKETWNEACARVAYHVASVEENKAEWVGKFYQIINELVFVPGGRILANAGTGIKNLMNCFVLPIEDSRIGIYETLKNAAEVFAWGGGVGYNFSNLREEGAIITTTGGKSSGPLSFMTLFDHTGEVIKQASRRGAQMGMLHISHPDIIDFIEYKSTLNKKSQRILNEIQRHSKEETDLQIIEQVLTDNQLTHFNNSVIISDKFMEAVLLGEPWFLISPLTKEIVDAVDAKELLMLIAQRAWESGDPGVFFEDKAEQDNMVPYIGKIEATNPCGEVPLLANESCCLGSLNLVKFYDTISKGINWEFLEYAVRIGIRFLDNIQTISIPPIEDIKITSESLRKLGLGVMGWADLLVKLELPYDSKEAIDLAEKLSWTISFFAWSESMRLAEERGEFIWFDSEKVNQSVIRRILNSPWSFVEKELSEKIEKETFKVRNTSVTSIAPTGSIALLAGVNSSIEPFYSLAYKRNITDGVGNFALSKILVYNPLLQERMDSLTLVPEVFNSIEKRVSETGSIQNIVEFPEYYRKLFKTAHEISWKDHIKMQAAWQKYTTNSVSKTINMPNDSTVEDVFNAFIEMWKQGLKGGTIYRDKSRLFQVLES